MIVCLEEEPTGCADRSDVGSEGRGRIKDETYVFALRIRNAGGVIY